jgi:polar amino acid transport system substrate-binding protein
MDRRNFLNMLTSAGVAAGVATATSHEMQPPSARAAKDAAERILDTRQLKCSYATYDPFIMKDLNTGKMSGLFYDLTNKIGELAHLEVSWDIEATYGTFGEDLQREKCDVYAGGLWPETNRAKIASFSLPAFYSGVGIYVRRDDHRFDADADKINDPQYRIATIDGEMSQFIQQSDYPKASVLSLPDGSDISLACENVVSGKADVALLDKNFANIYMLKNKRVLRNVTDAKPIRVFENTWAFAHGSPRLKLLLDTAIKEMLYSGYVDRLLAKYEQVSGSFYRVRPPIQ